MFNTVFINKSFIIASLVSWSVNDVEDFNPQPSANSIGDSICFFNSINRYYPQGRALDPGSAPEGRGIYRERLKDKGYKINLLVSIIPRSLWL